MAGLRAAEALRRNGFGGRLVIVGDEPHRPYNRPPLSKSALTTTDGSALHFRTRASLDDVEWRLGRRAVSADLCGRELSLDTGEQLHWDGLVVASGVRPRRLPLPGPPTGRHVLRTLDDMRALQHTCPREPLVIVGAGFVGCEVAATLAGSGRAVHLVTRGACPLEHPLQQLLGTELQRRHEAHGVTVHTGTSPIELGGGTRVDRVTLSDGRDLAAGAVLEAIGSEPDVGWLHGNGLDLSDGVRCDGRLRVEGRPDVVACGDVARFPNPLFDAMPRRVEHWTMVLATAARAGATLAGHLIDTVPVQRDDEAEFRPVPEFWSDQFDLRIRALGAPGLGQEDTRILEGDGAHAVVGYHRDGRLVGVAALTAGNRLERYRAALGDAWDVVDPSRPSQASVTTGSTAGT